MEKEPMDLPVDLWQKTAVRKAAAVKGIRISGRMVARWVLPITWTHAGSLAWGKDRA
jgi:hypothetical protein